MTLTDWLPNAFIAGVPKAGTSSLHRWIADHPDALGSRDKEACFFVDRDSHVYNAGANFEDGFAAYRNQFQLPGATRPTVILESTPTYVYQRTAIEQIPDLPTRPRCVFIVREPSEQIRSVFNYYKNNWAAIPANVEFEDFLTTVRNGTAAFGGNELAEHALVNARYVDRLRIWRDRLGADRMRVVTFDELRANPVALTGRVAEWLGLDPGFYDDYRFPSENETYNPRSRFLQEINVAVREHLPKGATYTALRSVYRRLNTSKARASDASDRTMQALKEEYADANSALASEFDLDLSRWR